MMRFIKSVLRHVPPFKSYADRLTTLAKINPGHYFSPIPSMEYLKANQARIFDRTVRPLPGIDLNDAGQLELLGELKEFYPDQPFTEEPNVRVRYYSNNEHYPLGDAVFLYCMIRRVRPKRIVEIGSGFSSFVMLDTNELHFGDGIQLTFIDPETERVHSRMRPKDFQTAKILANPVQDTNPEVFAGLAPGDILFVDSSHVAKAGSDVNYIMSEIVPRLPSGVYVHFHDVFYPFEYPLEWFVERDFYWNEDYMLRAFLQFNSAFRISMWNHYLSLAHREVLEAAMPLCLKSVGGSLWLQRV